LLAIFYGQKYPDVHQLIGVSLILGAIVFLSIRAIMDKKNKQPSQPCGGIGEVICSK
jgi:hypothetical protein